MPKKKIFVLNGHPAERSLSQLFSQNYVKAAEKSGFEVRTMNLRDLHFDPDFEFGGYTKSKALEPDLEQFFEHLKWSEHFVLLTPMWWGGLPAKLKGLFDRTLLPGNSFDMRNPSLIGLPKPLLKGKTGRVVLTSDTPNWFFKIFYGAGLKHQLSKQIFGLVGIKPVSFTHFSAASHAKENTVERWSTMISKLGQEGV